MSNPTLRSPAPRWIVCRNEERSVIDGEVFCPQIDLVAWHRCLECRLLEAVEDDRELGCGEVETLAHTTPAPGTADSVRWPQLIIEL